MSGRWSGSGERSRGQTTLDFAIGATIFLFAVAFVFTFIPNVLEPFDGEGNPGTEIVAERSSTHLVGHLLTGDPYSTGPTVLNERCTEAFFEGTDASDCRYDGGTLQDTFATTARNDRINVTVKTLDGNIVTEDIDGDGNDVRMARGDDASNEPTASTTRIVRINGNTYQLIVQIW